MVRSAARVGRASPTGWALRPGTKAEGVVLTMPGTNDRPDDPRDEPKACAALDGRRPGEPAPHRSAVVDQEADREW